MKDKMIVLPAILLTGFISLSVAQHPKSLTLVRTIPFPNVQGGFNHMSADAAHGRLFAAAPTNMSVEVVDLNSGKPLRSLPGERPAAARYSPEFNQLYVSGRQRVSFYDGTTLALITTVDVGGTVDELQYDPDAHELYTGCMTAGKTGIAVISIPHGKLLAMIALPGKPQGFAIELHGNRIFANTPELKEIAVIDRKARKLLDAWPLTETAGNTPTGLDEVHHRLFVGARQPAQLVVYNTGNGKPVARVPINQVADDLCYDAAHRRIYISCAEGFVDVIAQRDADHYDLLERIRTAPHSATSAFSPELNSLFVGTSIGEKSPAMIRVFKTGNRVASAGD